MDKKEFVKRFLEDQNKNKRIKKNKIPFKNSLYADIINILYEEYSDNSSIKISKENGIMIKNNTDKFNIKVVMKRQRVNI